MLELKPAFVGSSIALLVDNRTDTCMNAENNDRLPYNTLNITRSYQTDTFLLNIFLAGISSCPAELVNVLQSDMEEQHSTCNSTQDYKWCRTVNETPEDSVCQVVCDCQGLSCLISVDIIYKLKNNKVTYCEIWG